MRSSDSGKPNKTIVVIATAFLFAAAAALIITIVACSESKPRKPVDFGKGEETFGPWMKNVETARLSFDPAGAYVNKPVKGNLQVHLSQEEFDKLPKTVNVYQMEPMVKSQEEFSKIAAKFDLFYLHGSQVATDTKDVKSHKRELCFHPDTDVLDYYDLKKDDASLYEHDVPSEKKCIKIAEEIARDKGLLLPGVKACATNETTQSDPENRKKSVVRDRSVVFGMSVDGMDIRGPGSQMRIRIGSDGGLIWVMTSLRPLMLIGTYKTKPMDQVLREAQSGIGCMSLEPDSTDPVVESVSMFYYAEESTMDEGDPQSEQNRAVLPVYALMGGNCCIYVPAFGEMID